MWAILENSAGEILVKPVEADADPLDGEEGFVLVDMSEEEPEDGAIWDRKKRRWKADVVLRQARQKTRDERNPEKLRARIDTLEERIAALEALSQQRTK